MASEFDVPGRQQLDDLTRLFDSLCREKSPTALFSKRELFYPLYSYVKGLTNEGSDVQVTKAARDKICHKVGERMKKVLEVKLIFLKKKRDNVVPSNATLEICLRSTLKMYVFILCNILMSVAPPPEDDGSGFASIATPSQRRGARRKRRFGESEAGFGDDESGVDMDGRKLALASLIELCSPEFMAFWPDNSLESGRLNLTMETI
ncbi:unnamed protein product [Phytomonas sp. EM1]|nr:unnamed protein product [Phytomonas sp. EM1]|eukprot:CCW63177.1 unnamed protein product [Phytomonas sp. isolate EM1]